MAREVVPPFKVNASGISPLDAHVARLSTDPRIQQHLLPVPKSVAPAASSTVIGLDAGEFAKSATAKRAAKAKAKLKAKLLMEISAGTLTLMEVVIVKQRRMQRASHTVRKVCTLAHAARKPAILWSTAAPRKSDYRRMHPLLMLTFGMRLIRMLPFSRIFWSKCAILAL